MESPHKKSTGPKRHHYLPQGYLLGFSENEYVWVFDRKENTCRAQNVLNTAVIGHFYSTESKAGEKDPWIETELAKFDGKIPDLVQRLRRGEILKGQDRFDLAYTASLMMTRVPDFHESVSNFESAYLKDATLDLASSGNSSELFKLIREKMGDVDDAKMIEIENSFLRGDWEVKIHRNRSLHLMVELSPKFAEIINCLNTFVMHAPKGSSFVTCDRPFVFGPEKENGWRRAGLKTANALKVLPISRDLALTFSSEGSAFEHVKFPRDYIKACNGMVAGMTDRFLIGDSQDLVKAWGKRINRINPW